MTTKNGKNSNGGGKRRGKSEDVSITAGDGGATPPSDNGSNGASAPTKKKKIPMRVIAANHDEIRQELFKIAGMAVKASPHRTSSMPILEYGRTKIGVKDDDGYNITCASQTMWGFTLTEYKPFSDSFRLVDELAAKENTASNLGSRVVYAAPFIRGDFTDFSQFVENKVEKAADKVTDEEFEACLHEFRVSTYNKYESEPTGSSNTSRSGCPPETVLVSIGFSNCDNPSAAFATTHGIDGGCPVTGRKEVELATERLIEEIGWIHRCFGADNDRALKAHGWDCRPRWAVMSKFARTEQYVANAGWENPGQYVASDMTDLMNKICDGLRELRSMGLFKVLSPKVSVIMLRWVTLSRQSSGYFGEPKTAVIGNARRGVISSAAERAGYRHNIRRTQRKYDLIVANNSVSIIDAILRRIPAGHTPEAREIVAAFSQQRFGPVHALTPTVVKDLDDWRLRVNYSIGDDELNRHIDAILAIWSVAYPVAETTVKKLAEYKESISGCQVDDTDGAGDAEADASSVDADKAAVS